MARRATCVVRTPEQSHQHVSEVLARLLEAQAEREEELSEFPTTRPHDVDSEMTDNPYFDEYREFGGSGGIKTLTNFSLREFNELWLSVRDYALVKYHVGRGHHADIKPKDAFFMTLATLQAGGTWEDMAAMFTVPTATFTDTVTKMIRALSEKLYTDRVEAQCDRTTMRNAITSGHVFRNFPSALYAVDVTFQQSWRPGGSIQENGKYFSGKHHLYGLKVEVSVNGHGYAINCSDHAKGATHDITMFKANKDFHLGRMLKLPGNENLRDEGPLVDKFPDQWALLADKGYQGTANYIRSIHPKKGKNLSRLDQVNNDKVSSDRVLVENFSGRLNVLWKVTAHKFKWSEDMYDDIFRMCVALTNYNISINPLRDENALWYRQSQHRLIALGKSIKEKRRQQQKRCRAKKKRRLETALQYLGGEEDASEDSLTQYSEEL